VSKTGGTSNGYLVQDHLVSPPATRHVELLNNHWYILTNKGGQFGTSAEGQIAWDNKLGLGFWNIDDPRHPSYQIPQNPVTPSRPTSRGPSAPYPDPTLGSPRIQKLRALREAREPLDEDSKEKKSSSGGSASELEPSTSYADKGKQVDIITAGIHHVPTLQGTNPLTTEGPTGLMEEIEQYQGNVPFGPPAAAIFAASADEPAQANYTWSDNECKEKGLKGGSPPKNFAGDRKDSDRFWEEFSYYWKINRKSPLMKELYSRVLMAISYMKGDRN
jgi:hypothetical protein